MIFCTPEFKEATTPAEVAEAINSIKNTKQKQKAQNEFLKLLVTKLPSKSTWVNKLTMAVKSAIAKIRYKHALKTLGDTISLATFANSRKSHIENPVSSWDDSVFDSMETLSQAITETFADGKLPNIDQIVGTYGSKEAYVKQLAEGIAAEFFQFKEAYEKNSKVKNIEVSELNPVEKPIEFLYQLKADGVIADIPNAVLFSMMAGMNSWIATQGSGKALPNSRARSAFLYGNTEQPLSKDEELTLQKIEHSRNKAVQTIGRDAARMLLLQAKQGKGRLNKAELSILYEGLELALGGLAINTRMTYKTNRFAVVRYKHVFKFDEKVDNRLYQSGDEIVTIKVEDTLKNSDTILRKKDREVRKMIQKSAYDTIRIYQGISGIQDLNKGMPLQEAPADHKGNVKSAWVSAGKKVVKVVNKLQKVAWTTTDIAADTVELVRHKDSQKAMLALMGMRDTTGLIEEEAESIQASNEDKLEHLREFLTNYDDGMLEEFYIRYELMNQQRIMMTGKVNPQASHIIRNLVRAHKKETYGTHNINWFKLAILHNLQQSPERGTSKQVLQQFDEILERQDIKDVIEAFTEGTPKQKGDAIQALLDSGDFDADLSVLAGIKGLVQYQKFLKDGKNFDSDIALEIDGKSNGFAMALMQFPLYAEELEKRFRQVGTFLRKGRSTNDIEGFLNSVDGLYEDLARAITGYADVAPEDRVGANGEELDAINPSVAEILKDQLSVSEKITSAMRDLVKYPSIIYMYGGGAKRIATESVDKLITGLHKEITDLAERVNNYNTDKSRIELEIESLEADRQYQVDRVKEAKEDFADLQAKRGNPDVSQRPHDFELVEAALSIEKLEKEAGDAHTRISDKISKLRAELREASAQNAVDLQRVAQLDAHIYKLNGSKKTSAKPVSDYISNPTRYAKRFSLRNKAYATFRNAMIADLKNRYSYGLHNVLGPIAEGRTEVNNAVAFTHIAFNELMQKEIADFEKEHGFTPPTSVVKDIATTTLKEFFPTYSGPLDIGDIGTVDLSTRITKESDVGGVTVPNRKGTGTVIKGTTTAFEMPGVKPIIREIINMDASIQASTLDKFPNVLSIYDGIIGSPLQLSEVAEYYSQMYLELNRKTNLSAIAADNVERIWGLIQDKVSNIDPTDPKAVMGSVYSQILRKWGNLAKGVNAEVYKDALVKALRTNAQIKEDVDKEFVDYESKQMFINQMGELTAEESTTVDSLAEADVQQAGISWDEIESEDKVQHSMNNIEKTNITPNTAILNGTDAAEITVNNVHAILEAFSSVSQDYHNTPEDQKAFNTYLGKLLDIMLPSLKALGKVDLKISDIDNWTHGDFFPNSNEMNVAINRASPVSMLSQTPEEVYTHELTHALITEALKGQVFLENKIRRMRDHIEKVLDKQGGYKALLPENPTPGDVEVAKSIYEYLFNKEGSVEELSEFVAYGLTNRTMMKILGDNKTPTFKRDGDTWLDKIINLVVDIIDKFIKTILNKKNQSMHQDLLKLAMHVSALQDKHIGIYEQMSMKASNFIGRSDKFIQEKAQNFAEHLTEQARSGTLAKPYALYGLAASYLSDSAKIQDLRRRWMSAVSKKTLRDFLYEMGGGVLTPTLSRFLLKSKHVISTIRATIERDYLKSFNELLPDISDDENRAFTDVLLKADLSTLLDNGYTPKQIKNLLNNPANIIEELNKQLGVFTPKELRKVTRYMDELAQYIVTGEANERAGYDNATQIIFDLIQPHKISKQHIDAADTYITLKALQHIQPQINTAKSKLTVPVLSTLLAQHSVYKQDMLNNIFHGDTYEFKKGYLRKRVDNLHDYKIGTASQAAHMKKLGYPISINLGTFPGVNVVNGKAQPTYMFIGQNIPQRRLFAGAASYTAIRPGYHLNMQTLSTQSEYNHKATKQYQKALQNLPAHATAKVPINTRPIRKRITTKNGRTLYTIVGYRAIMSDAVEESFMQPDMQFSHVMAHMQSNYKDQISTLIINDELVERLVEERNTMYDDNPKLFTNILAEGVEDAHFKMLPVPTKNKILQLSEKDEAGNDAFYVRTDILDKILGYEEMRITDTEVGKKYLNDTKHPVLHSWANRAHYFTRTILGEAVNKIVIATYDVVSSNLLSNVFNLTLLQGIPIKTVWKHVSEGIAEYNRYSKDAAKLRELETRVRTYKLSENSIEAKKIKALKLRLQNNKMHYYVEHGVQTLIVEDINEASTEGYYGRLIRSLQGDAWEKKIPRNILAAGQWIAMSSTSKPFQALKHFVTMTDFLARYTMVEHATEQAKRRGANVDYAKRAALHEALEAFVHFDENMSPRLQMLNDLGMFWYMKYWTRNQRTARHLLKKHPTNLALAAALQATTGVEATANVSSSLIGLDFAPSMLQQLRGLETTLNPIYGITDTLPDF